MITNRIQFKKFLTRKWFIAVSVILVLISAGLGGFLYYQSYILTQMQTKITQLTATRMKQEEQQSLPPIAVVMTTYNRADFLPRAIDSVLKQTKTDFHFIIVDDGSTDDTLALLYDYMQKDNRIYVYPNKKNQGISVGRNKLLDLTESYQYIANIDSDDFVALRWLEKLYEYVQNHPEIVVTVGQTVTTNNLKKLSSRWSQNNQTFAEYILRKSPIPHSGSIFRRSFFTKYKLKYNTKMLAGEDYDMWMRILSIGGSKLFGIFSKPLFACRDHITNSAQYYQEVVDAHTDIRRQFYYQFYSSDENDFDDPKCEKMKHMRNTEKGKNLFTAEQWDYAISKWCPTENQEVFGYFIDNNRLIPWADYVIKTDNPSIVYRLVDKKKLTIIRQINDEIILKGGLFDKMHFQRHPNKSYWVSE